ncbi:unnamed protein product [Bursaphelenchus xylophilus]|uniref:(pine wood nematode) hypothetical protein n=1 Tax=Bursaphelenchus xylophilus TaxID=6326 RepID=A0A1I7RRN2_BURXY|nr:unnamed protein product [Bursaphelenchus xylophilus]CAG9123621.1 unnamed protein product [Bursaphelenchus xylophilus]
MSDNEFSDGDLDVEGGHSPLPSSSYHQLDDSKKNARAQHNALERRRRDNIKDMYTSLREEIPNLNESDRASRAQILKKTIDHIQEGKATHAATEEEVKQLKERNEQLKQQIAAKKAALQGQGCSKN